MCPFATVGAGRTSSNCTPVVPAGSVIQAQEITRDGTPGYEFAVLGSHDEQLDHVLERLVHKARRLMGTQYVERREVNGFPLEGISGDNVFGRFEFDPESDDGPLVIIDGQPYSWSHFGRLLTQFEGFQFKRYWQVCAINEIKRELNHTGSPLNWVRSNVLIVCFHIFQVRCQRLERVCILIVKFRLFDQLPGEAPTGSSIQTL